MARLYAARRLTVVRKTELLNTKPRGTTSIAIEGRRVGSTRDATSGSRGTAPHLAPVWYTNEMATEASGTHLIENECWKSQLRALSRYSERNASTGSTAMALRAGR